MDSAESEHKKLRADATPAAAGPDARPAAASPATVEAAEVEARLDRLIRVLLVVGTTGGRAAETRRCRELCRGARDDDTLLDAVMNLERGPRRATLLLAASERNDLPLVRRLCRLRAGLGERTVPAFQPLRAALARVHA